MTYRDYMAKTEQNMGWCKPFSACSGRLTFCENEGKIQGIIVDGAALGDSAEAVKTAAMLANPDYNDYEGWSDRHILFDGDGIEEIPCRKCPHFSECFAMDDEFEEG